MSDQTHSSTPAAPDSDVITPSPVIDLNIKVKELIENSTEAVQQRVIDTLAEDEIAKRVVLIMQGIEKHKAAQMEVRKIKPDHVTFNDDGSEATKSWSKSGLENKKKAEEAFEKIDKALTLALTKGDYEKLKNALGK